MANQKNNTENQEMTPIVSYYKKINALRAKVSAEKWEKKGERKASGSMQAYDYLKLDDIKTYIRPYLHEVGLDMYTNIREIEKMEPIGNMSQHWIVWLDVRFIDTDTGFEGPMINFPGESADTGSFAIAKAISFALKSFLTTYFLGSEGSDPEDDTPSVASKTVSYTPSTAKEQMLAKSKAVQNAAKPPVKPETPAPAPAQPEPAKPAEEAPKAPAEDKPAEAPADVPANPVPASKTDFTVAESNKASLDRLISGWVKAKAEGKISEERYNEAVDAFENINSQRDVSAWIGKYRTVKE